MVGFDPKIKKQISANDAAIAGAVAGSMTRIVTQPLDVLKIRFQLQLEEISTEVHHAKYRGLFQATQKIIAEENVFAFWKGHSSAQLLSTTYGLIQFPVFQILTKEAYEVWPKGAADNRPFIHFVCGGLSGCLATLGSMPFDVIRTRLIGQREPPVYNNTWHAMFLILKHEGAGTLFRGLTPALLQIYPFTGIQFAIYGLLSSFWRKSMAKRSKTESSQAESSISKSSVVKSSVTKGTVAKSLVAKHEEDKKKKQMKKQTKEETIEDSNAVGWVGSMFCGMVSGWLAKTAIYPLDVVKKRLQVQGFDEARKGFGKFGKYSGLVHCLQEMTKTEGLMSVFKGYIPSCGKSAAATGCNFCFYEKVIEILDYVQSEDR